MENDRYLCGNCWNPFVEYGNKLLEVRRPPVRDGSRSDGILEDQIPADNPGEKFTERGIRVRVCRAGYGHHRSKLRVTERGKDAGGPSQHKRKHQRRPG